MAERPEKSVFFVGKRRLVDEAFSRTLTHCDIRAIDFESMDDCCKALGEEHCDLIVVDLDGDATARLRELAELEQMFPRIRKLALIDHGDIPLAVETIRAGAANCLEKPIDRDPLLSAIQDLLARIDQIAHDAEPALTPMEIKVLHSILEGRTNRQTAKVLKRSPRTIEVHRGHIMHKLGASSMVDLVKIAAKRGYLRSQETPDHP